MFQIDKLYPSQADVPWLTLNVKGNCFVTNSKALSKLAVPYAGFLAAFYRMLQLVKALNVSSFPC